MTDRNCRTHRKAYFESLEQRLLLSAATPTDYDQYLLELVNRARANPSAEAALFGITVNEGPPAYVISTFLKQPLAFNPYLIDSARKHSVWMLQNSTFSHDEPGGKTLNVRIVNAGYPASFSRLAENLGMSGSTAPPDVLSTVAQIDRDLFVDATELGRGHRLNMLDPALREMGAGVSVGDYIDNGTTYKTVMVTEDFGTAGSTAFLTGVAYDDAIYTDQFYTPGEGIGNLTITAVRRSDNYTASTTTWSSGGYSLALPAGTYDVTAASTTYGLAQVYGIVISADNVKQDFTTAMATVNHVPTLTTVATLTGATEGTPYTITYANLLAASNAFDFDGDKIYFRITAGAGSTISHAGKVIKSGRYQLGPGDSITWQAAAGVNGAVNAFTVFAWDGLAASDPPVQPVVQVDPVNMAPSAIDQSAAVAKNGFVDLTLAGSDLETPAADLVFTIVDSPLHGTLTPADNSHYRYTPDAGYTGPDSFTFTTTDNGDPAGSHAHPGDLTSPAATAYIRVGNAVHVTAGHSAALPLVGMNPASISLSGKFGWCDVYLGEAGGPAITQIEVINTATDGTVTLTAGRNSRPVIGAIEVTDALNAFKAAGSALDGAMTVGGGLKSLTLAGAGGSIDIGDPEAAGNTATLALGSVADLDLTSLSPLKSLAVASWVDTGPDDLIQAPWIGKLTATGNFQAHLDLTGAISPGAGKPLLASAAISGNLTGIEWDLAGNLGKVTVTGTAGGSICTDGDVSSITVGAAVQLDVLAGMQDQAIVPRHAGQLSDFVARDAVIGSFTVKGLTVARGMPPARSFTDSNLSAAVIGKVSLVNVLWDNAGLGNFGIWTLDDAISHRSGLSVSWSDQITAYAKGKWTFYKPIAVPTDMVVQLIAT